MQHDEFDALTTARAITAAEQVRCARCARCALRYLLVLWPPARWQEHAEDKREQGQVQHDQQHVQQQGNQVSKQRPLPCVQHCMQHRVQHRVPRRLSTACLVGPGRFRGGWRGGGP